MASHQCQIRTFPICATNCGPNTPRTSPVTSQSLPSPPSNRHLMARSFIVKTNWPHPFESTAPVSITKPSTTTFQDPAIFESIFQDPTTIVTSLVDLLQQQTTTATTTTPTTPTPTPTPTPPTPTPTPPPPTTTTTTTTTTNNQQPTTTTNQQQPTTTNNNQQQQPTPTAPTTNNNHNNNNHNNNNTASHTHGPSVPDDNSQRGTFWPKRRSRSKVVDPSSPLLTPLFDLCSISWPE